MRFIRICFAIIVIMLQFLFCSCVEGEIDLNAEISPSSKSLNDLATRIYDEAQLSEIIKFEGSIKELNAQYPIECLRNDNEIYRVSYLGNESVAILVFDGFGNKLLGNVYNTKRLKSDFNELVNGQSLEEVRALDPTGLYLFLFTGRNDMPKESFHCTKDGCLITIEYNDSNTIIKISEELI